MKAKGKVVLFYPAYGGMPLSAPLCLLTLAAPLLEAGFAVCVIDAAIHKDWRSRVLRECADALCLGISLMTGPMIHSVIGLAKKVKEAKPDLPVILGGWHPTLIPGQTLEPPFVDAVVRGQGELTLLEIAERLAARQQLDAIPGTTLKRAGVAQHNPERPVVPLDRLPRAAFHLADFDAYERVCGVRKLAYATSVGCPYACNYCTDMILYKRRFNGLSSDRVVSEVAELVERYRVDEVPMLDSNFPVDIHRALRIARGFVDSGVRFRWSFQASTDFLSRMSDDEVRLLAESGVTHMGFGTESTSAEVLELMNKRHQRLNEMHETARKAALGDIHVTFNLIFGYPGETEAQRFETLRTMTEIAREFWNVSFSPNVFTPYPGLPIWPQLRKMGVREPQTFEEWGDLPLGKNVLPWLQGEELSRLRRVLEFFLVNNQIHKAALRHKVLRSGLRRILGAPLRWRIRAKKYSFPWEIWVARSIEKVTTRRSLLTGQTLSTDIGDVC